jgi:hypothetical protein
MLRLARLSRKAIRERAHMKANLRVHYNQGGSMIERWEAKVEVEL